jgi:hypothetical protein
VVIVLLATVAVSSQMDQKFAQAQQQNAQALRQYTWKSRTEILKGGETKNVQINLMRYAVDGTIEKRLVSSTPQQNLPTRGIRGLIAQKKKEEFMETLDSLAKLAKSYGELPPAQMHRFMAAATVTPEMVIEQKLFRISGGNVLQPGDSMTLWVDAVTRRLRRVEVHTTLERKPVRVESRLGFSRPAGGADLQGSLGRRLPEHGADVNYGELRLRAGDAVAKRGEYEIDFGKTHSTFPCLLRVCNGHSNFVRAGRKSWGRAD